MAVRWLGRLVIVLVVVKFAGTDAEVEDSLFHCGHRPPTNEEVSDCPLALSAIE